MQNKTTYAMSRRRRTVTVVVCLLLGAVLVWMDHRYTAQKSQNRPLSKVKTVSYDTEKYHGKTFKVINVVDGDTIDIDIPDGEYEKTRIRLWGVDTPETKNDKTGIMYFGPQASEFTKKLTTGKNVTIYLDEDKNTRGKYGRLLAYVKLPDGRFLNEALLNEGFAYSDLRFRHSLYHKYKRLQAAAKSQKKGLWQKVTREQLPQWLQRKKPNLLLKK